MLSMTLNVGSYILKLTIYKEIYHTKALKNLNVEFVRTKLREIGILWNIEKKSITTIFQSELKMIVFLVDSAVLIVGIKIQKLCLMKKITQMLVELKHLIL